MHHNQKFSTAVRAATVSIGFSVTGNHGVIQCTPLMIWQAANAITFAYDKSEKRNRRTFTFTLRKIRFLHLLER